MERQIAETKGDLLKSVWYMRGGLSYSEAMLLNSQDREIIGKIVKENLETTKRSGLPFF
jgi:hypothetical protein